MSTQVENTIRRLITIPQYYQEYIDNTANLYTSPKQCCFNHKEDSPSFSYSPTRDVWSCFGQCHIYGADVITMHQLHMEIRTRKEAIKSLCSILGIDGNKVSVAPVSDPDKIDEEIFKKQRAYVRALRWAKDKERYLKLDYLMTQCLPDNELTEKLEELVSGS